jgi:methionyl-tRNA formyltransferase
MKVVILAPIGNSLYSLNTTHLLAKLKDVHVTGIVVRTPWDLARLRSEFQRDGLRLLRKVLNKWLLREKTLVTGGDETLLSQSKQIQMHEKSLGEFAKNRDIPILTVSNHNRPVSQLFLEKAAPDLIVFTGGGLIRENILRIPHLGVLNCHSGWLPKYRGMDVIEWAVLEADSRHPEVGITLHFMDRGVDTGPILLQQKVGVKQGDTFAGIRLRLEPMMVNLIIEGVCGLRDKTLQAEQQAPEGGSQFYIMHPRLQAVAVNQLKKNQP